MKQRRGAINVWILVCVWGVCGCGADAIEGPSSDTATDTAAGDSASDTTTSTSGTDTTNTTNPDTSGGGPVCGDGAVSGQEACDTDQFLGADCTSLGFDSGDLACTSDCKFDMSGCRTSQPTCGDGIVQAPEVCDTDALGALSCESLNLGSGTLKCASSCTIDASGCGGVGPTCGDGVAEGDEPCDGQDFKDATCALEGFVGGSLLCNSDCTQVLTVQCTRCGDNVLDNGEACDGSALNNATCQTLSFDGGDLDCDDACAFDTSACTRDTCGNGTLDADEDCEGSNVGTATCANLPGQSFDAGLLSCNAANCTFNTSACTDCGDGSAQGSEACDGPDVRDRTCITEGFDGGQLSCSSACALNTAACTRIPTPLGGQVVLTEIMHSPLAPTSRDWFELHNATTTTLNLQGCRIELDSAALTYTVPSQLLMLPGEFLTFAASGLTSFTPDHTIPGLSLSSDDIITLTCGTNTLVDEVLYISGPNAFPALEGSSVALKAAQTSAGANDDEANWCMSATEYAAPDRGSPGEVNPACITGAVDFCRLQYPGSIGPGGDIGALPATVYGRLYEQTLTDQSPVNNTHPNLIAQGGYGPLLSDPRTQDGWTWLRAEPNPAWNANGAEINNDEYQVQFPATIPAGDYSFTFRFSFDAGTTWLHCDLNGVRSDGTSGLTFSVDQTGTLEVP